VRHQAGADGGFEQAARPEEEEAIFGFFSSACYSGYGDDAKVRGAGGRGGGGGLRGWGIEAVDGSVLEVALRGGRSLALV